MRQLATAGKYRGQGLTHFLPLEMGKEPFCLLRTALIRASLCPFKPNSGVGGDEMAQAAEPFAVGGLRQLVPIDLGVWIKPDENYRDAIPQVPDVH
jgi:hypothetical protein